MLFAMKVMISSSSLLSILVIERVDGRVGLSCLISLLSLVLVSSAYERFIYILTLLQHVPPMVYLGIHTKIESSSYVLLADQDC